jgi:hypothetical protein
MCRFIYSGIPPHAHATPACTQICGRALESRRRTLCRWAHRGSLKGPAPGLSASGAVRAARQAAPGKIIDEDDARLAISYGTIDLDHGFFEARWQRATPGERRYLRAMAKDGDGPSSTGEGAARLEKPTSKLAVVRSRLIAPWALCTRRSTVPFSSPSLECVASSHARPRIEEEPLLATSRYGVPWPARFHSIGGVSHRGLSRFQGSGTPPGPERQDRLLEGEWGPPLRRRGITDAATAHECGPGSITTGSCVLFQHRR